MESFIDAFRLLMGGKNYPDGRGARCASADFNHNPAGVVWFATWVMVGPTRLGHSEVRRRATGYGAI